MRFNILKVTYFLALITPLIPKIEIYPQVYIYPVEVLLVFLLLISTQKVQILFSSDLSKLLSMYWIIVLFATLLSFIYIFSPIGFLKSLKGLSYVSLFYVGTRYFNKDSLITFVKIGLVSMVINILLFFIEVTKNGLNLWKFESLSSGLSNKYLDLTTFSIVQMPTGAHGIYGSYCILILVVAYFLYFNRRISTLFFFIISSISLLTVGVSVSREALLLLVIVFMGISISSFKLNTLSISKPVLVALVFVLISIPLILFLFPEKLPIISKLTYTFDRLENFGTEGNIQLRINGWILYIKSLVMQPSLLLTGVGYNKELYVSTIINLNGTGLPFPTVPESIIMIGLAHAGLGGLILIILIFYSIFSLFTHNPNQKLLSQLLSYYFIGILLTNILSGASFFSDLLYGQILLILGFIHTQKHKIEKQ